jgi:tRNA (guanine37-N1)-methyltransferase
MVMTVQPIDACITQLKSERTYDELFICRQTGNFEPKKWLTACRCIILSSCADIIKVWISAFAIISLQKKSLGDYVLVNWGVVGRFNPFDTGVLSDETSLTDSFQDGLLSGPIYTRPADYKGWKVPEVLTSGNFAKIDKWREDAYL